MPTLAAPLDFAKYEGRNFRAHILGTAPATPVTGQLYFDTGTNTLYWWNGTAWISAVGGGTPADATPSTKGIVQLAGDLAGTAASPQIAAGAVTDAEVAAANKDGAAGTVGMRSLGAGAAQAMPGNRTLDAVAAPAAALNLNSQRITSLADPTGALDGANKQYVDAVAQGLAPKDSVRAATTANIVIATALNAADVIDGVTLANGDRVLVKDQSAPAENGIYVVAASPARATDADAWAELPAAFTFVEQGTVNADTGWVCTADQGGTLNTTAVTWAQFSGAGAIVSGAGLTKTGSTLDVGAGAGIQVNADSVQVANNGITNAMIADGAVDLATADVVNALPLTKGGTGQTTAKAARETGLGSVGYYSSSTHGAGTTITITQATHGLRAARGLQVQVQDNATGNVEIPDISVAANGDVTVTFGASVTANSKLVTIIG
jgi:Repeat of unknown function (DUF5907)